MIDFLEVSTPKINIKFGIIFAHIGSDRQVFWILVLVRSSFQDYFCHFFSHIFFFDAIPTKGDNLGLFSRVQLSFRGVRCNFCQSSGFVISGIVIYFSLRGFQQYVTTNAPENKTKYVFKQKIISLLNVLPSKEEPTKTDSFRI